MYSSDSTVSSRASGAWHIFVLLVSSSRCRRYETSATWATFVVLESRLFSLPCVLFGGIHRQHQTCTAEVAPSQQVQH